MEIKPTQDVAAETQPVTVVGQAIVDVAEPSLSTTPIDALDIFGLGGKASDIINQHTSEHADKAKDQFTTIVDLDPASLSINKPTKPTKVKIKDKTGKIVDKPVTTTETVVEPETTDETVVDPVIPAEETVVDPVIPAEETVVVEPVKKELPTEESEREQLFNRLAATGNLSELDEKGVNEFFGWRTAKDKAIIDTYLPNVIADAEALGQNMTDDEMDGLLAGGQEAVKSFKTILARNVLIAATVSARNLVPQITNQMQALNHLLNPIFQQHVQTERAVAEHEFFSNYPQFSESVDLGDKGKVNYSDIVHTTAEQLAQDPKNGSLTREQYFAKVAEVSAQHIAKLGITVAHAKGTKQAPVQETVQQPVQVQQRQPVPTPPFQRPTQSVVVRAPGSTSSSVTPPSRTGKSLAQSLADF